MAFAVTDFKSNMSKVGGGARPSLYEIDINGKAAAMSFTTNMNILCKAASIPASTIAPLPINYAGRAYKWNGFRTFDRQNLQHQCTAHPEAKA